MHFSVEVGDIVCRDIRDGRDFRNEEPTVPDVSAVPADLAAHPLVVVDGCSRSFRG